MNDVRKVEIDRIEEKIRNARHAWAQSGGVEDTPYIEQLVSERERLRQSLPADGELIVKPSHSSAVVAEPVGWQYRYKLNGREWSRWRAGRGIIDHNTIAEQCTPSYQVRCIFSQPAAQVPEGLIDRLSDLAGVDGYVHVSMDAGEAVSEAIAILQSIQGAGHGQG